MYYSPDVNRCNTNLKYGVSDNIYTCAYVCLYTMNDCMCVYYVCMYTCVYVCMHAYILYTHACIHRHTYATQFGGGWLWRIETISPCLWCISIWIWSCSFPYVMQSNQEKPITFACRTLNNIEQKFSQLEKEALAIIGSFTIIYMVGNSKSSQITSLFHFYS